MQQEIPGLSKCNQCGNTDFKLLYRGNIGNLNLVEKHFQFSVLTKLIEKFTTLGDQELLDVGANTGVFLSSIKDKVKTAQGIEASEEATNAARTIYGLDVQSGLIADVDLPDERFDIITMFDVIEHLTDPMNDLRILSQKLKSGGKIFITTHDIETLLAKISGRHNPMLMYQHFFHFSPRTLANMLETNGYKIIGIKRFLKSWSFEYLFHLVEKIWPGSKFASTIQFVLHPLYRIPSVRKFRIVSPQRDFFMLIAEKPESNNH